MLRHPEPRRLHLLRHAKSSWDEPGLADIDRPLSARGRRAGALVAEHMEAERIEPDAILVSPALRTEQTLQLIRPALPASSAIRSDPRIYGASAEELLDLVQELPSELGSALLIGHNPGLQDLALLLASAGSGLGRIRRKYPTGALVTLRFEGPWSRLGPAGAELLAFVRPKQLEA